MLTFLLLYAAALVMLGWWTSRRSNSAGDFFVAGRSLSPGLLFATFLAANLGAGTTVGAAEFGYRSGLGAWWWVGSAGLGSLVLAVSVGPKIYRIATENGLLTVGDYLEFRYARSVRLAVAGLLWLGSLAILAGQLIAVGLVLQVVAGIPRGWGSALGALLAAGYFVSGGLRSTASVNLVQVAVKGIGFVAATAWIWNSSGGWDAIAQAVAASPVHGDAYLDWFGLGVEGILTYASLLIPAFFVSPGLLQKLFGARDQAAVRSAIGVQGLVLLAYAFLPVLLGMFAFVAVPALSDPGLALPTLLAESLPSWLAALMLAAIFSAEVSSADAVLFMLSTSFVRDGLESLRGVRLSDAQLLTGARWSATIAAVAGFALAVRFSSVLEALSVFYSLLTVSLLVPLVAGLYWPRMDSRAALWGIGAGVAATIAVSAGVFVVPGLSPTLAGILVSAIAALSVVYSR